jgi:site-specific recombinase XerD
MVALSSPSAWNGFLNEALDGPIVVGLPKDLVLYLARHECGTKICREKGIEYARRLLGHTNISTTQRYMHLDDSELADAQDLID